MQAGSLKTSRYGVRRLLLPGPRPYIHLVGHPVLARPRLAQPTCLLLTQRRKLIVVIRMKRSLRVPNQREPTHTFRPDRRLAAQSVRADSETPQTLPVICLP